MVLLFDGLTIMISSNAVPSQNNAEGSRGKYQQRISRTQTELNNIRKKGLTVRYNRQFTDLAAEQVCFLC